MVVKTVILTPGGPVSMAVLEAHLREQGVNPTQVGTVWRRALDFIVDLEARSEETIGNAIQMAQQLEFTVKVIPEAN